VNNISLKFYFLFYLGLFLKGTSERPGLAVFAISEFLSMAEKNGKSIAVSFYEVDHQDHAVDLLNPEQSPILVLEDHGRIQFKGLTQVKF
jgi:kinesin family protein 22